MTQSKRGQVDNLSEQHVPMQLKLKILMMMMMMLMMMKLIIGLLMPLNHLIKIKGQMSLSINQKIVLW